MLTTFNGAVEVQWNERGSIKSVKHTCYDDGFVWYKSQAEFGNASSTYQQEWTSREYSVPYLLGTLENNINQELTLFAYTSISFSW